MSKDRLEEFFKDGLEHYEEEVDPAVWDRMRGAIPPPPTPSVWMRARPYVWLLVLLLFVVGTYHFYTAHRHHSSPEVPNHAPQVQHLDQKPSQPQVTVPATSAEQASKPAARNLTDEAAELSTAAKLQTASQTPDELSSPKNTGTKLALTLGHSSAKPDQALSHTPEAITLLPTISNKPLSSTVSSPLKRARLRVALSALPTLSDIPAPTYAVQEIKLPVAASKPRSDRHRYYYAVWFEPFHTQFPTLYKPVPTEAKAKALVHHIDYRYGVTTGMQLDKRWSVEIGFGFMEHLFRINDETVLEYTHENAIFLPNGNVSVPFQYPNNGLITIRTGVTNELMNDGSDIMPGETFEFDYRINYRLKYYSIPMWLRYKMSHRRLYWQLKGGMVFHSRFGTHTSLLDLKFSFNRLQPGFIQVDANRLKSNYWEAGLGTAVSYALTDRFHLSLEPTFYLSLTPVFSDKTFTVSMNANVSYRF